MNVKKFTSYAVALMMSVSLAPINANADNAVTNGYYNDSGQWVQGELDQTLPEGIHSVDKTAEALGNNTYRMKLKVVTKQNVETFTKKSATVLVVDTSNSMDGNRIRNLRAAANVFVNSYAGDRENVGRYLVEYGNYIYLGTCWNPISGIYYRNLKNNLTSLFEKRGDKNPGQKAGTVATNILNVMYDGNFPDGATSTKGTPCIMRVNKYTYETELVYVEKESSAFVNWNGYRMAMEYKGKLYFACAGYPTSRLLQIDPKTKATKVVMQKTAENSAFSNGIRGLTVMNGKLLVSLATDGADPDHMFENGSQLPQAYQNAIKAIAKKDVRYKDDNPRMQGARLLETDDPENVDSWKVIANQETFDNLPACWIRDSINGGGLWDLAEFNGSLYVSMVTGKTDATTGVTNKQGFAVYRGDPQKDGSWKWTPIIGDTSKGAKYEFGLGKKQSCAGNLYVYKDHLYIGGYNDPMLDLAEIGNKADFHLLYQDLKNPACLNRMDKNGNIELINDDGFGAASTQYLWRFSEYNNKLVIGTFDITTLAKGFTQLTDGSLSEMTP